MGGPALAQALFDEQGRQADAVFEKMHEEILGCQDRIRERFKDVFPWAERRFEERVTIHTEQRRKC